MAFCTGMPRVSVKEDNMEAFKYHVQPGRYRHFKGNEYEVIAVARHSETMEELVVYKSLKDGEVWARPKAMFVGKSGEVRRFTKLD